MERPRLVVAALTLLRAFIVAGRPSTLPASGSFEEWSRIVAGAVAWVGMPDPQATRTDLDAIDSEKNDLLRLIDALDGACGLRTVREPADASGLTSKDIIASPELREILGDLSEKGALVTPHAAGNILRRFRRRVVGGRRIEGRPDRKGFYRWRVEGV